jgi:hypothetical protein
MTTTRVTLLVIFALSCTLLLTCGLDTSNAFAAEPLADSKPATTKEAAANSDWKPLQIISANSSGGATLTVQKDGSIFASGNNSDQDVYTVTATTKLTGITAVQIEVIPDEALDGKSGRGRKNNLALTEFHLKAAPAAGNHEAVAIALTGATADFSQQDWPVAGATDGKPETGWAIDPEEATPHAAVFATTVPAGFEGGTVLTFVLEQSFQSHNIGKFRLWVTTVSPVPPPYTTVEPTQNPVKVASGKKEAWTLSTGDTELTVGVDMLDQLVIYKLVNPDAKWNWTDRPAVIPLPTWVVPRADAAPMPITWRFQEIVKTGTDTVALTFQCVQLPELSMKSIWKAASPRLPGPVQHMFQIQNKTASEIRLTKPVLNVIVQPNSGRKALVWTFPDQAGSVQQHALTNDFNLKIETKKSKIGQLMPFCLVDDSGAGGLYLGMEDQMDFLITVNSLETKLVRASAQYVTERNVIVPAGSMVATLPTYLGVYQGDVDDGCNRFKHWFWNNKTPANHRDDPLAPWTMFGGLWSYETKASKAANALWWSEEATYRKGLEQEGLAGMGFEAVEMDAFWEEADQAGDWPSSTKIMVPLAHKNGLKLNLYLMDKVTWDTREYLKNIWNEHRPDMWRNDFQDTDLNVQAWAQDNCPKNYRFNMSCSSCDFKSMSYTSLVDIYDDNPDVSRKYFYSLSYTLPPGQINILMHLPYAFWQKGAPTWGWDKDRFVRQLRSTMLAGSWIAVAAITPEYNLPKIVLPSDMPEMIPHLKSNLAIYKWEIRPLIREGNLYHDIVDVASGFDGAEYNSPSQDRSVVLLFGPAGKSVTVRCKRLNPEQNYEVKFTDMPAQNTKLTGAQLMKEGLPVTFTGTAQSEIILIGKYQ